MTDGYEPPPNGRSMSLRVSPSVAQVFRNARKGGGRIEARIASNVEYIQYLEDGTRKMAARPMIGPYLAEYREMVHEELREALNTYPGDWERAAQAGIAMATIRIMRAIADRTAVDTGRAKGSWTAYLPGGRTVVTGPVMTAEQQRAIIKNRRQARRNAAKGGQR